MGSEAIIIGVGIITFIMFEMWVELRENHPNLSLFFFAVGIGSLNALTFFVGEIMRNDPDLTYLSPYGNILFQLVMLLSIFVAAYVLFSTLWTFIALIVNWIAVKIGMQPPFKANQGVP